MTQHMICNQCSKCGEENTAVLSCSDSSCPCHTTQTTPSEEWEKEFEDGWFDHWHKHHMEDHAYSEMKRFAKSFAEKTRKAAYREGHKHGFGLASLSHHLHYEKGVRDSLEVVKEAEESYLIKSVHEDDPEILKASYNSRRYTIQVIKEAISTLLK